MNDFIFIALIVGYVVGGIIGLFVFLAPLFTWHHVAKMRHEVKTSMQSILQLMQAQKDEQERTNTLAVEMQQRYMKTMQYVCDRLADICDNVNGVAVSDASVNEASASGDSAGSDDTPAAG